MAKEIIAFAILAAMVTTPKGCSSSFARITSFLGKYEKHGPMFLRTAWVGASFKSSSGCCPSSRCFVRRPKRRFLNGIPWEPCPWLWQTNRDVGIGFPYPPEIASRKLFVGWLRTGCSAMLSTPRGFSWGGRDSLPIHQKQHDKTGISKGARPWFGVVASQDPPPFSFTGTFRDCCLVCAPLRG